MVGNPLTATYFFRTYKIYAKQLQTYTYSNQKVFRKNPLLKAPHIFNLPHHSHELRNRPTSTPKSRSCCFNLKALGTRNGWSSVQLINIHLNEGIVHLGVETSAAGFLRTLIPLIPLMANCGKVGFVVLLLMVQKYGYSSPVEVVFFLHLPGFIHPRWCSMSCINTIVTFSLSGSLEPN